MTQFNKKVTLTFVLLIIELTVSSKLNFELWVTVLTYALGLTITFLMMLSQELENRVQEKVK